VKFYRLIVILVAVTLTRQTVSWCLLSRVIACHLQH